MSDEIFPELPGLKWDSTKKPQWSTKLHETASGKETAAAYWSFPKWFFGLSYEVLEESRVVHDLKTIGGFFLARKGRFDSFLYRDPSDCQVEGQVLGVGDGSRTTFQMIRSFGEFDEPMKDIVGAIGAGISVVDGVPAAPLDDRAPTFYVDGIRPSTYSVSASGLLTLGAPPAAGAEVMADFSYYFRCRFLQDEAEFTEFMQNLWELKKLEMVTRK